jgi:hypothetical protein
MAASKREAGNEQEERGQPTQFQKFVFGTVQALIILGVANSVRDSVTTNSNVRAIEANTVAISAIDSRQDDTTKMMYQIAKLNCEMSVRLESLRETIKELKIEISRLRGSR